MGVRLVENCSSAYDGSVMKDGHVREIDGFDLRMLVRRGRGSQTEVRAFIILPFRGLCDSLLFSVHSFSGSLYRSGSFDRCQRSTPYDNN